MSRRDRRAARVRRFGLASNEAEQARVRAITLRVHEWLNRVPSTGPHAPNAVLLVEEYKDGSLEFRWTTDVEAHAYVVTIDRSGFAARAHAALFGLRKPMSLPVVTILSDGGIFGNLWGFCDCGDDDTALAEAQDQLNDNAGEIFDRVADLPVPS